MKTLKKFWRMPIVKGALLVLVVFLIALAIRSGNSTENLEEVTTNRSVDVTTAAAVAGQQQITLIGTVRAFTEAEITTERAGRITSVNTRLGNTVSAGQVIATIENASEQAAVLQAQGAYEATLAAASQTTISVSEAEVQVTAAENALKNAIQSAYNIANNAVQTNIDTFFSNPDSNVPGLRVSGRGQTSFLNGERVAYQTLLPEWRARATNVNASDNIVADAKYSETQLDRTISFVDTFLTVLANQPNNEPYTEAQLDSFITNLTNVRSSLLSAEASINAAESQLASAEEGVLRARTSATGGSASAADAQVKQALGSLRSAQASLAKTILRTPISGSVNELNVQLGDFVGSFEQIAKVANNNALEVVAFVGDNERDQLREGDEVVIDGSAKGVITTIAPSIDAETRKTEVRIATEDQSISNGDTVRITKEAQNEERLETILVPLSAVKFEATDGYIMQVENGTVTQKPVQLGSVRGSLVEIDSGLAPDELFISDVRGLTVGASVNIRD